MVLQAARFVGSVPENYDHGLGPHIFEGFAADIAQRVAYCKPASVLELAAGTGIVTRALRDALPDEVALLASDLNEPMLAVARRKFADTEAVEFTQADATALNLDDATFDVVACQFGVMFFPDKQRSYSEVLRVLKPGGKYIFNCWGSPQENPFARIAQDLVEEMFPADPPGFYKVPFGYNDAAAITAALESVGFTDVYTETVALTSKILSAERFARGLVFGNPLHEEILARDGDAEQVCTRLEGELAQGLGDEMPLQALLVEAGRG